MTLRLSGGRRLESPAGATARPTAARVRQAVLNILAAELPGCRWLDLCCGSGVMACEALQRGAAEVVAIERDRRIAAVARRNLEAVAGSPGVGAPAARLRVIQADAGRWLASHAPLGAPGDAPDRQVLQSRRAPEGAQQASLKEPGEGKPDGRSCHSAGSGRQHRPGTGETDRRNAAQANGDEANPPAGTGPQAAATTADREAAAAASNTREGGQPEPGSPAMVSDTHRREQPFDLIYCDPPWPAGLHCVLTLAVARGGWLVPGGTLIWECPSDQVPTAPAGWMVRDQRRYGGSTVVLLKLD